MEENLAILQAHYGLIPLSITPIRETQYNELYKCTCDGKDLVFRVGKRSKKENTEFEIEILCFLSENNVPVPMPQKTLDERRYVENGELLYTLFNFIEGAHVEVSKSSMPSIEIVSEAGKQLAQVHNAVERFVPVGLTKRTMATELERVLDSKELFASVFLNGAEFISQVQEALAFMHNATDTLLLIHNDYRAHNILFGSNGHVTGVLDFDWSCFGAPIKDVAHSALEWSFPDGADEPDLKLFNAFIDSYNLIAINPVSKNQTLLQWVCFGALSDTATYLADRIDSVDANEPGRIRSYMYKKYTYFKNIETTQIYEPR